MAAAIDTRAIHFHLTVQPMFAKMVLPALSLPIVLREVEACPPQQNPAAWLLLALIG